MSDHDGKTRTLRRHDPGRKERIVNAALDVIAQEGVAGVSHRKIAEKAGVQLGSMSYHFKGIEEIVAEAFTQFALEMSAQFESIITSANSQEAACDAVVAIICGDLWRADDGRALTLSYELYARSTHDPAMKLIMRQWMARTLESLGRHFDVSTAKMLDSMIEGLSIHRSVDLEPLSEADVKRMVTAVVNRESNQTTP